MSWKERRQKGQYREVAFYLDAGSLSGGRRLAIHEYPGRDLPYPEDLGRAARNFSLSLFVAGTDYDKQRDQLIAQFEKPGSGTLVHPYMGALDVVVQDYSLSESTAEGGIAKFDVSFIEVGASQNPVVTANTKDPVTSAANKALEKSINAFVDGFQARGFPQFVRSSALAKVNALSEKVQQLNSSIDSASNAAFNALLDLGSSAADLDAELGSLILQPRALASRAAVLLGAIAGAGNDVDAALAAYTRVVDADSLPAPRFPTLSRQRQQQNDQALNRLQGQLAVVEMARASSDFSFDSHQQAVRVRDIVLDQLDDQAQAADDELFQALNVLRTAVFKDINARGAALSRIVQYVPATTLPTLVLAHQFYGNVDKEQDLIKRNSAVQHPSFVVGGQPLEVLAELSAEDGVANA